MIVGGELGGARLARCLDHFYVKRASGFGLCVAYIALHSRDRKVSLVEGGGDGHSSQHSSRCCCALRLDSHVHQAASRAQTEFAM
jgi:hypothetical protein